MPAINLSFAKDPNTLMLALIYGMLPAVIWIFFWMHEKPKRPKRGVLFTKAFIGGVLAVIAVLPVQYWIATLSNNDAVLTILWAASEEVLKFSVFAIFVLAGREALEPVEYPVYIVVVALGFAGFENALYFLQPLQASNTVVLALAGTMRYLGTTLLHALSQSMIGFAVGFSFFKSKPAKVFYAVIGLAAAIALHSTFNILISRQGGANSFQIFGMLWVLAVIAMLLFEALRKMGSIEYRAAKKNKAIARVEYLFRTLLAEIGVLPSDEAPLVQAIAGTAPARKSVLEKKLAILIADLRGIYASYLMSQGNPKKKARETARSLVADGASAKGIAGILAVMREAKVLSADAENGE